jgi:hypothetical protein
MKSGLLLFNEFSVIRKTISLAVIALALLCASNTGAQALVQKGEAITPAWLPFYTMPGDPDVQVFAEVLIEVRVASDPQGGVHYMVLKVKDMISSTVVSDLYDYEFLGVEPERSQSSNQLTPNGLFTGTVHYTVSFIRIDRDTSLPLALIIGTGMGHMVQQGGDAVTPGEVVVLIEKIDWTVTAL